MPDVAKGSITSARLVLRVEGEPHFLVSLSAAGHTKRMGYSALSRHEAFVATGSLDGAFERFMESVPDGILERAGVYEDAGTDGQRCQWRIEFDSASGPIRFDLTYHAGSAGLPPAMAQLVANAESITGEWYEEQVPEAEPPPVRDEPGDRAKTESAGPSDPSDPTVHGALTMKEYLSFDGRIGRMDYVMLYTLPLLGIAFVGGFADGLLGWGGEEQIGPLGIGATLLTIWPSFSGWAKRLHDFDKSLWIAPGLVVAGIVVVLLGTVTTPMLGVVGLTVWGLAMFALMVATYFWPGTKGPNRFGPPRSV